MNEKKILRLNDLVQAKNLHTPKCEKYQIGTLLGDVLKRRFWSDENARAENT